MDRKVTEGYDRNLCPILCNLQFLKLYNTAIRYLHFQENSSIDLCSEISSNTKNKPLFLAKDVFQHCNLSQNNVQRIHARYSKEGKATRLELRDFRIHGINQNRLWFYNIQGLFEVIFHYHSQGVQRECVRQLTDVFLSCPDGLSLPESVTVSLNEESAEKMLWKEYPTLPSITAMGENLLQQTCSQKTVIKPPTINTSHVCSPASPWLPTENCDSQASHCQCLNPKKIKLSSNKRDTCKACLLKVDGQGINTAWQEVNQGRELRDVTQTDTCKACLLNVDGQGINTAWQGVNQGRELRDVTLQTDVYTVTTASVSTQTEYMERSDVTESDSDFKVDNISDSTSQMDSDNTFYSTNNDIAACRSHDIGMDIIVTGNEDPGINNSCLSQLSYKSTCPYCLYLSRANNERNEDLTNCIIRLNQFIVFEYSGDSPEFAAMLYSIISQLLDYYPKVLIPPDFIDKLLNESKLMNEEENINNSFLQILCRYVGKELHNYEEVVLQNAHRFKEEHIKCIDNLPPPLEIIDFIFPVCMKELILHWMSPQGRTISCDPTLHEKVSSDINSPDFHIIQLILEFVNNALISGVAHVVYSRVKSLNH